MVGTEQPHVKVAVDYCASISLTNPPAKTMNPDEIFLARAVELAQKGSEQGNGGPFGALIVRDGVVLAEAWNRVIIDHDPTAHAEINAIRTACQKTGQFHLTGCTLYTSSEPCPMCLAAAYWAKIERIVFANSRAEAAAIGFCDDWLYDELQKSIPTRQITMEHHPLEQARAVMQAWTDDPQRILY